MGFFFLVFRHSIQVQNLSDALGLSLPWPLLYELRILPNSSAFSLCKMRILMWTGPHCCEDPMR